MAATVFSSKGQVVIPKALRDAKGFAAGVKVEVVDHPDGVLLKILPVRKKRPISELSGMLAHLYTGPPLTIEQMHQDVEEAAVERYLRSKS